MKIKLILTCFAVLFLQAVSAQVTPTNALWTMGYNSSGQLGDGTYGGASAGTNKPEQIVSSNVMAVAAGENHSLFLLTNGSLWAMGNDNLGQLGDGFAGNNVMTNKPKMIVPNNVTAIAGGLAFSMFVDGDGNLWGMGDNSEGQLGDGHGGGGVFTNQPEMITNGVSTVACGFYHTLFLTTNGDLWAMGNLSYGQLGNGVTAPTYFTNTPQFITNGVTAIACGADHSLFIKSDGSLWGMGDDGNGQLGDGTGGVGVTVNLPEFITNGVTAVAAGEFHSLFIETNGSLWAMGYNFNGQLGDGTTNTQSLVPEMIEPSNVTAVAGGYDHSLFIKSDGSLWAMGADHYGQLGDGGNETGTNVPKMIAASNVTAIAAGDEHSLFIAAAAPPPQIEVLDGTTVLTNGETNEISFGSVELNQAGTTIDFTVTNLGSLTLTLTSITMPAGYALNTNAPATITGFPSAIAAGGSGMFGVQLITTNAGTNSGNVTIANNDPTTNGSFSFAVTGVVTNPPPPQIEVAAGGVAITNGQTNAVDFGFVQQVVVEGGGPPPPPGSLGIKFSVTNSGGQALDVGVTLPSGYTNNDIVPLPTTVNPGTHRIFYVVLNSTTLGVNSGYMSISNNDPTTTNLFIFPVTGFVTNGDPEIITLSALPSNGGLLGGGGTFPEGSSNTVTATAHSGFLFTNWTVGGNAVSTSSAYTFTVTSNVTLVANFQRLYNLTVNASPTNGGTVSGGGTNLLPGSSQTLTAMTNGGFTFVGWSGVDGGTNNPLMVTMTTNLNITAIFLASSTNTGTNYSTNLTLTLLTNGNGTVSPNPNGKHFHTGQSETLTATALSGSLFSNWTGSIITNKSPLTLKVESNMVLQANFVPNPFLQAQGTYNGLFSVADGVTEQTAGMLKGLLVGSKGTYSGALAVNGVSHTVSGSFNLSGQATNNITRTPALGGLLTLAMTLNWNNSPPQVTGTVTGTNWVATNLTADLATNALPSAQYTMLMPPDDNHAPPTNLPGGYGYALITNYAGTAKSPSSATAKITGALADGTTFSQTVPVSQDGFVPIYASLYSNKGLLLGWINLNLTNTDAVAATSLTWIHPKTTSGLYTNGFTNLLLTNQILLSYWTNSPTNILVATNLSCVNTIDGDVTLTNFTVTINTNTFKLTTMTGPKTFSGSIAPKTGLLTVTFGSGASKVTGYGAILLNSNIGGGYFVTKTNAQAIQLQGGCD